MLFETSKNLKTQPLRVRAVSLCLKTPVSDYCARAFIDLRAKEELLTF